MKKDEKEKTDQDFTENIFILLISHMAKTSFKFKYENFLVLSLLLLFTTTTKKIQKTTKRNFCI